ncbi:MAG: prepilin peptidase [Patescibacteria group bacterium]|nr:prepilin peptidase [Patescibacteria group bacterium]
MGILYLILMFLFGAIIGSFLNVVILRLPQGQPLSGRSHCMHCRHILSAWELVPLFSYIFLKGKCWKCKSKISPRYFIIETITGLLFMLSWLHFSPSSPVSTVMLAKTLLAISIFLTVFVIDYEYYLILDKVVFFGVATGLLLNLAADLLAKHPVISLHGYFAAGLIGALAAALPFFLIWYFSQGQWMGFGDVKLALFLGIILGWPLAAVSLMAAVLLGGIAAIFLLVLGVKTLKSRIPFGTFLSIGGAIALFYGQQLLNWYLALLGF